MTHPDHRNKGLFVELALSTFQLCRELNIRCFLGSQSKFIARFVHKLGWRVADIMDCFIIHTGGFRLKDPG